MIGRRPAVFAAGLYAWSSWSLSMSRWAFPATLDHLLVLAAVGLVWRALGPARAGAPVTKHGIAALALAGLLGGLATYAYHTGRIAPLALAVVASIRLGVHGVSWRRALPGLAIAAVVGLLTMAPLIWYIASDIEGYNRRVGNVSVFDSNDLTTRKPLGLFLQNVARYGLMWHIEGEGNGRHHMPAAPMLDPFSGLLLALGLLAAFDMALRRRGMLALLAFWLIYFIPGVLSGNAPHAMRSLGTLAPACALAGLGLTILNDSLRTTRLRRMLPVALLTLSLAFNVWLYFGVMRVAPQVYGEFDLSETAAGRIVQAADRADVAVFMPAELIDTDTVRYLSYRSPVNELERDPVPAEGPALILLPPQASVEARNAALAALGPEAVAIEPAPRTPDGTQPLLVIFGRGEAARDVVTP
ncbi:MAG: hypothetical protein HC822_22665 [Oscillochloris sp.]|nr:hypothetical protein [Oscillochloris sp.]